MEERNIQEHIALSLLKGIGPKRAKTLLSVIGSVEGIFKEKTSSLGKIQGIGISAANKLNRTESLLRAEKEIQFINKHKIDVHLFQDKAYPKLLSQCNDSPIVLFSKGNINYNAKRNIAIVGTRKATGYGKQLVKDLVHDLAEFNVQIVSGLAYGIDITAHQSAINESLPTLGVLAHGLDSLYPMAHKPEAIQMIKNGGLVTEFLSETIPDKENFPKRNRIVAGMCEATIVIERAHKGGALITAGLANDYNREVFAFPGNIGKSSSIGCNQLIQKNRAHLITSAQDLIDVLGWENDKLPVSINPKMFENLSAQENIIINVIKESGITQLDTLSQQMQTKSNELLIQLFNLEMKGIVRSLPGKRFEFI